MTTQSAAKKRTNAFLYDAQTLFITSKPLIRYSIAAALVSVAVYLFMLVPQVDINHAYAYLLVAGVYGWEISLGFAVMAAVFGVFKLLALLPLGLAIVIVAVAILYAGV